MKSYEAVGEETFLKIPAHKNTSVSIDHRNEGNKLFNQGKYFESLECFNKSLCVAQSNSKEIPLIFASRATVYFETKEYQKCLENIQLARETGYPAEKIQILNVLEEKCKKFAKSQKLSDEDDPWSFFKLSYPANEKIPFIIDCVELRKSKKFGRFIITNQGQFRKKKYFFAANS
jgi:tetratricopeptide (TPR) repeat protein